MLLAESFVLLALDPDGTPARGYANQAAAALGVTGALVTELIQDGHVELPDGRIRLTGSGPADPILAGALDQLGRHDGRPLRRKLGSIKRAGWREVVDAMVDHGVIGREKRLLRPTRHPVTDAGAHALLLAELRNAATGYGPMDDRTAALLALAGPSHLLEVVAPERADRRRARQRIAEAAERVPAAAAVKRAVDSQAAGAAVGGV